MNRQDNTSATEPQNRDLDMKNPFKFRAGKRKDDQEQPAIGFLQDDDNITLPLKLIGIGCVSVLFFGLTPTAALGFFLGLNIWLVSRTARLALVNANQAEGNKQYVVFLERRIRDLETSLMRARYQPANVPLEQPELEKAS